MDNNLKQFNLSDLFLTSWDQLDADQAAAALIYKNAIDAMTERGKHVKAGISRMYLLTLLCRKKEILKKLTPEQLYDVANDLAFMAKPFYFFHITWLDLPGGRMLRPEEKLSSLTFYQFIKADCEFSKYTILCFRKKPEQSEALDRLVTILYQPGPWQFNEDSIADNSQHIPRRLTLQLKMLILHAYVNCRRYIVEQRCTNLFPGRNKTDNDKEPEYLGPMWQDLLYDLSETPTFSGLGKAKNARLYEALDYLEKKAKEKPVTA